MSRLRLWNSATARAGEPRSPKHGAHDLGPSRLPNDAREPTPDSVRSYLAPASSSSSGPALGPASLKSMRIFCCIFMRRKEESKSNAPFPRVP